MGYYKIGKLITKDTLCLAHSLQRCQSESTTLHPDFINQAHWHLSSSDFSYKIHKHMNYSELHSNIDIKCTAERESHALHFLCRPSSSTLTWVLHSSSLPGEPTWLQKIQQWGTLQHTKSATSLLEAFIYILKQFNSCLSQCVGKCSLLPSAFISNMYSTKDC